MSEQITVPTEEEIAQLPRWARVAFAARCARLAQPVFLKAWPSAPREHVEAIDRMISIAESSAAADARLKAAVERLREKGVAIKAEVFEMADVE